jgi:hypothetical protein
MLYHEAWVTKQKKNDSELLKPSQKALLDVAMDIIETSSKDAKSLGFNARAIVIATMPYTDPGKNVREFTRRAGPFILNMVQLDPEIGLPFGSIPRLAIAWITTEAVRTRSRVIELGGTFTDFLSNLGLTNNGGVRGNATRVKEQCRRLFNTALFAGTVRGDETMQKISSRRFLITDASETLQWLDNSLKGQPSLWTDKIILSEGFFNEITQSPVPIDLRALKALARSPMAIDIYCWCTYRASHLEKDVLYEWNKLYELFGGQFGTVADFKRGFLKSMLKVHTVYPELRAVVDKKRGMTFSPSPTHIPKLPKSSRKDVDEKSA